MKLLEPDRTPVFNTMRATYLARALRNGKTPIELGGIEVGNGVQKTAYLIDKIYIIKENTGAWCDGEKSFPVKLMRNGFHPPKQYRAGKWIIQEAVSAGRDKLSSENLTIFRMINLKHGYDTHGNNVGQSRDGKLVCFDW